ncbi:MAG TPA: T9SS type A sorting domain-containing protein, partial [Candidatus Eisenbacteria bacterium]|nr:T9SS type A sorting domain-containing protein [Candidatus Eisenbacteria bacterium]
GADLTYPKTDLGPGDFAWDYLKLHSTRINNDKGMQEQNLLHSVWPFPGTPAIYDSMVVDVQKLGILQRPDGGYSHADAVFDPIFAESEPDFDGDIDTLYAYGAAGPEVQGRGSVYHGKLCGLRWHSTKVNPVHGRIQWFGFSMYYMQTEHARNTFRQSMDWLRQDDGPVPVGHLSMTALRNGNDVTVRWTVTEGWEGAAYSVYREEASSEREKLSAPYSGRSQYEFVDRNAPGGKVSYWIEEQDRLGGTVWHGPIALEARDVANRARLAAVRPNPVSGPARLTYSLGAPGHVLLSIHDVSGREVGRLVNESQDAGMHEVRWDPDRGNLAAGFYVIRLETGDTKDVRKVLLVR